MVLGVFLFQIRDVKGRAVEVYDMSAVPEIFGKRDQQCLLAFVVISEKLDEP